MNTRSILLPVTAGLLIFTSLPVDAATGKKRERAASGRMLGRFDRNHDQKIDGQEAERLRRMFSTLTALDTDHDGKLNDSEIAAAKVEPGRRARKTKTP